MKIKAGNTKTSYELNGNGESIVLIHGFSDNLTMWFNQISEFSEQYKILTYDVRGHGLTETLDSKFSIDLFADDLYELINALNIEETHVLGYSMGGRIGLNFAIKYPEVIKSLILANSGIPGAGFYLSEQEIEVMDAKHNLMKNLLDTGDMESISEVMTAFSFSPGFKDREPEIYQKYKEIKLRNNPENYFSIIESIKDNFKNPPDLTQLKCPTLLIGGNQDGLMDINIIKSMESVIPNVQLKTLPTGHASALEKPDQFNHIVLEFLDNF